MTREVKKDVQVFGKKKKQKQKNYGTTIRRAVRKNIRNCDYFLAYFVQKRRGCLKKIDEWDEKDTVKVYALTFNKRF